MNNQTTIPRMTAAEMRRINKAQRDRGIGPRSRNNLNLSSDSDSTTIAFASPRRWQPPKLTRNGKAFVPAIGEIGSWVAWDDEGGRRRATLTGQVWAKSNHRGQVWVVRTLPDGTNVASSEYVSHLRPAADPAYQLAMV